MIWKGTPYYARIEYNDKKDLEDEIPVYSINKPRPESLAILKLLSNIKGSQNMMKKNKLLVQEFGLLNPISIAGGLENPIVAVEDKGRQSNVIFTTQGESTLKIFEE